MTNMKKRYLKTTLALAVMSAGLAAVPAQAVQINFTGGRNPLNLETGTGDPATWTTWNITYNLPDANGFFQQILFTAPGGTMLSQGTNFAVNVNIAGIFTNDS